MQETYDFPPILCANALSGNRIPSNKIFRLNLDLPDSRSEKMIGNSQKRVPRRCKAEFHFHQEGVTFGADVVQIDSPQDLSLVADKTRSHVVHRYSGEECGHRDLRQS